MTPALKRQVVDGTRAGIGPRDRAAIDGGRDELQPGLLTAKAGARALP